jgi:Spy/CpxP family protein refolding chaperone
MMGPGYGPGMMGPGYGGHMMGYGPHMGWRGGSEDLNLTREQAEKIETARESFYRETEKLREKLYDRSADLRRELSRETPDRSKVQGLQKELSELEGELDQKRLAHRLEVRKIAPQFEGSVARGGYGPGAGWCWQ